METGLIIWRNNNFPQIKFWSNDHKAFVGIPGHYFSDTNFAHTDKDFEEAKMHSKTMPRPGTVYFLKDSDSLNENHGIFEIATGNNE